MTLLQQIQNEAVSSHTDLPGLLRRCRILGERLGVVEFKEWVGFELEGYPRTDLLPSYRRIRTPVILGHFKGTHGAAVQNAQIPLSSIPERLRQQLSSVEFCPSVASIASMIGPERDAMEVPWPLEVVRIIGQGDIYDGMYLMQAVRIVNRSMIRGLLDQIQNRILGFALALESRSPEAGEAVMPSQKVPEDQVRYIFNTTIKGDVHNLAQAGQSVQQTATSTISLGEFPSLCRALINAGVPEPELHSLERAVASDKADGEVGMGSKVKLWLADLVMKAGAEGKKIATDTVVEVLKRFFLQ